MSALTPPFDIIPKLPGKGVNIIVKQINQQTDKLVDSVNKTVQATIKLPKGCDCDDPNVKKVKDDLAKIQKQITKLQEIVPKIQKTVNSVQSIVKTAAAVKSAIALAQLSNPVTAPLFIAQQLTAIQDATIANAIASLDQFKSIPASLTSKLATIIPPLTSAIQKVAATCNGDLDGLETLQIPNLGVDTSGTGGDGTGVIGFGIGADGTGTGGEGAGFDYNDLLPSEFYNELNVSDDDLEDRSDAIQSLLQQQRDLLSSLLEAPSKVYQEPAAPNQSLGKIGDYYIDTENKLIYGPKLVIDSWGMGINY
jgi:division protein CdvB (Snf7/Vps24/ESCRT-III family)